MESNKILFTIFLFFFSFIINKYFLSVSKKNKFNLLKDNQFKKPQAFHLSPTYRLGGITIYISLILVFVYSFFYYDILYIDYFSFCTLFFLLGLMDDIKIDLAPKFRLLLMTCLLILLIIFNDFYVEKTGLEFLNNLLAIDIFSLFFICLCFLFIINGSNLIDGFNGLLGIHSLLILFILFFINFSNQSNGIIYMLFCAILLILIFLLFNFPKAQMFLGDGGAYLIGALISVSIVKTSILNPQVSPFFFCILLFYLFFEVFFSFFRKLLFARQSPLLPDNKHLHMYLYKFLLKKNKNKLNSNYMVSVYANLTYLFLLMPAIFFMKDGLFCRFYFFLLIIIYIYFYKTLSKKVR